MVKSTSVKYFDVSWDLLHRDSKALAWRLSELKGITQIVAITRGGMVPAAVVARELDIRLIDTVCIASYDNESQGKSTILKSIAGAGEGVILVDDLVDTGKTAQILREMLPKAHLATVYAKPLGLNLVDTYITQVSQDTWIRFPWDLELNYAVPIAEQKKKV